MAKEIRHTETLRKNTAIAPGLTIVYWGREDAALLDAAVDSRASLARQWGNCIWWYADDHIHATLSALTRTRYDQYTALRRNQLPVGLHRLAPMLARLQSFEVEFSTLAVRADGQIQFGGQLGTTDSRDSLRAIRELYQILDPQLKFLDRPKSAHETLHVNLGYFQRLPQGAEPLVQEIKPVTVRINALSVVHYLRRTLEPRYILGQYHLPLGAGGDIPDDPDYFYDVLFLR